MAEDNALQAAASRGNLAEGKKGKPFLPIAFILRRAPLILLFGAVLTILFLFVLLPRVSTVYTTDGTLLVDMTKQVSVAGIPQDPIPGSLREHLTTMVQRLGETDVLTQAIKRLKPAEYPAFFKPMAPPEVNAALLKPRLSVKNIDRTYLISLTLSADSPEGLAPVLNQLMQYFVEKNQNERRQLLQRRINYLNHEREKITARLEEFHDKLQQPVEGLDQDLFIDPKYTAHVGKLEILRKYYWDAENKRLEHQNRYQLAQANRSVLPKLNMQALARERVTNNDGINKMSMWTYEQTAALRNTIDGLTEQNEDRRNVEERIRAMDDYMVAYKDRTSDEITRQLHDKQIYELDLDVTREKNALDAVTAQVDALRLLEQGAAGEYNRISRAIYDALDVQFNIEQLRERLKDLNSRIDDAEVEAMAPVQLFIDKVALAPSGPDKSNFKVLAIMSLVLGFGSVFSFVLAFDFVDNRLRDPIEVNGALGGPGADPLPLMEGPEHPPGSFVDATLEWPRHPSSLAIRSLAVRMELEIEKFGARVIALAGLGNACGVTTLSLGLGHVLKVRERRVLVVECNLIRPGLARVQGGLRSAPGLWDLISGAVENSAEVIQTDPRRQIDLITAGSPCDGIPDRSAFMRAMAELKTAYDVIILDAASILQDEFSYYAATHADAVLLVGREDVSLYRDLRQSIDVLVAAQVPAVSAILNFTRAKRAERVRSTLHAEMRGLSKKHWMLHGMARRALRGYFGKMTGQPIGGSPLSALSGLLRRLRRRSGTESGSAGPVPVVDLEPAPVEPTTAEEDGLQPSTPSKWVFDKKRKVLINLTGRVKYPEGRYAYRSYGQAHGFEILGGPDQWVNDWDVTYINK